MWAQRLQQSKPLIIALVVMMLVFSFQASRPQAVGLDTAVKIVAGSNAQKVVRAIGEKAGVAFSPKSLDATTKYINGQAALGNTKYVNLAKEINIAAKGGVVDPNKSGFKKYVLNPVLWLTGADLLIEAYDAFNDGRVNGSEVDYYDDMYDDSGFYYESSITGGGEGRVEFKHKGTTSTYWLAYTPYLTTVKPTADIDVINETEDENNIYVMVEFEITSQTGAKQSRIVNATFPKTTYSPYKAQDLVKRIPSLDDAPDISNVSNYTTYKNDISDDDYSLVTYDNDVEIYAPDETNTTETNNYLTPWNPKMSDDEFTIIVQPIQDVDVIIPGDDDDLPTGPRPDPVEVIDRSMLDVARQSYDYLGDSVDTAISSMRDVTDNVTGLIAFLDDTFDWLPAEWRALFGSAFILGVFAHFFRR